MIQADFVSWRPVCLRGLGTFDASSGTRTFTLGAGTVDDVNISLALVGVALLGLVGATRRKAG